jgi:hypothetical protein
MELPFHIQSDQSVQYSSAVRSCGGLLGMVLLCSCVETGAVV